MNRIREIFGRTSKKKPLDSDAFVIGLFQVVFGLWIMMPMHSFSFIPIYLDNDLASSIFYQIGEFPFGLVVFLLGICDILSVYYRRYKILKNMEIVGAMYWATITMGWVLFSPTSTAVPVYGFFTVFSVYEFFSWAGYSREDLPNNGNIGNI